MQHASTEVRLFIGFVWQGFGTGGDYRGGFCKVTPCTAEPISVCSKTDPVLTSSESISDDGSASGITEERRGSGEACEVEAAVWQKE